MAVDVQVGQNVRITTSGSSYEGTVLPSEGKEIILKLSSGYNVGLFEKNIQKVEQLPAPTTATKTPTPVVEQDASKPTVMILHTGGTIASKVDYATGGAVAQFKPEEIVAMFPELTEEAHIESELFANMMSDDFRFVHFNLVAQKILEHAKKGVKNFIVTSGTDFLHYMATGLSFLLKDVPVGVLVMGAQRSSDRGSSDAAMNLACAVSFLASKPHNLVGVCMHENIEDDNCVILSGTNVRKNHSSRRDAFKPVNKGPLATINYKDKLITLHGDIEEQHDTLPETLPLFKEDLKIGMFYSRPQLFPEELDIYENYDGLVLVGGGLGSMPITTFDEHTTIDEETKQKLTYLASKMPVVMSVQTIYGKVDMDVYATGRNLQRMGVLGNGSLMTPETTYLKLAWLLSNGLDVKENLLKDFATEMNCNGSNLYW